MAGSAKATDTPAEPTEPTEAPQPTPEPEPAPPVNPGTQAVVDAVEALPDRIVDALRTVATESAATEPASTGAEEESEPAEYEVLVGRLVRRDSEPGKPFNYTRFRRGDPVTFPAAHQAEDRDRHLRTGAIKPAGSAPQAQLKPDPPTLQASGLGADPVREAAIVAGVAQTIGANSDASPDDQPQAPNTDA